jgi:ribose transport system permease protein
MSVTVPSPQSGNHAMKVNKALLMRLAPLLSLVLLVLFRHGICARAEP